ncbi:HAH_0734 family protein [Natrialbaceae archaeon A-CW2]|uniref:HAH_0734 family protein n=1 Tax=Natronosalvus amylolyticus TaxID=2961994 RepID=UPI0020C98043|nr:HAH_0734 family protein [Natronosalvus amylolyticus]
MKRLIIHGDPGIRKGAVIELDGEELVCFGISRNGEWHGPDRVQLWCTVGEEDEFEDFQLRNFTPHWLEVERVDASEVSVLQAKGDLVA